MSNIMSEYIKIIPAKEDEQENEENEDQEDDEENVGKK